MHPTLSAGIILVHRGRQGDRYLLLRAYHYWDFPKGGVNPGEDPIQGARRELEEETTQRNVQFTWGYEYRETEPYSRGKIARYYVAETLETKVSLLPNPILKRPEHHEFRWVTYTDAYQLVSERVKPILKWAHGMISVTRPA